jgi:hypothetical protein
LTDIDVLGDQRVKYEIFIYFDYLPREVHVVVQRQSTGVPGAHLVPAGGLVQPLQQRLDAFQVICGIPYNSISSYHKPLSIL